MSQHILFVIGEAWYDRKRSLMVDALGQSHGQCQGVFIVKVVFTRHRAHVSGESRSPTQHWTRDRRS